MSKEKLYKAAAVFVSERVKGDLIRWEKLRDWVSDSSTLAEINRQGAGYTFLREQFARCKHQQQHLDDVVRTNTVFVEVANQTAFLDLCRDITSNEELYKAAAVFVRKKGGGELISWWKLREWLKDRSTLAGGAGYTFLREQLEAVAVRPKPQQQQLDYVVRANAVFEIEANRTAFSKLCRDITTNMELYKAAAAFVSERDEGELIRWTTFISWLMVRDLSMVNRQGAGYTFLRKLLEAVVARDDDRNYQWRPVHAVREDFTVEYRNDGSVRKCACGACAFQPVNAESVQNLNLQDYKKVWNGYSVDQRIYILHFASCAGSPK
jgi:hypothetical protein